MKATNSAECPAARTIIVQLDLQSCMVLESVRQCMLADGVDAAQASPECVMLECLWATYRLQRTLEELSDGAKEGQ